MKNNFKPSVVVSHTNKQHAHQLCFALQQKGYLNRFIVTIWYKPQHWLIGNLVTLIKGIIPDFIKIAKKRYFAPLNESLVEIHPLTELTRLSLGKFLKINADRWNYRVEQNLDKYVARRLQKLQPTVFIGYENSSLRSFQKAKEMNKITILDLAQVHHNFISHLRDTYPYFKKVLPEDALFAKVNQNKSAQYPCVDYIFTLSEFAKKTLIDVGISEDKIYKLYLGFDPDNFQPKKDYNLSGKFSILFVGLITYRKGLHLLLEAFRQLNLPQTQLTLIGSIADGEDLLSAYEGMFEHIPYLPHNELVTAYQEADLMIFPSYLDSWGMVVSEAMACGTPVIVSENTGSKDVVKDGGG
ncbi:MAG: glycosyltransferase family 4 protein, partial [Verrucomicrobia bacterium]|nr:glycosyltransferase family 4 protein [Cytophagales bacterium]